MKFESIPEDGQTSNSNSSVSFTMGKKSPTRKLGRLVSSKFSTILSMQQINSLPLLERTPIILIRFASKATPDIIKLVKERLEQSHIRVITDEVDGDGFTVFGISTTQQELEYEADHLNLFKPLTLRGLTGHMALFEGTIIMEPFTVSNRASFKIKKDESNKDSVYDGSGIFTSADRVKIMHSLIESLTVLRPGVESSYLARKFNETFKFPAKEIDARYHKIYLFDTLRKFGLVDEILPLHSTVQKDNLLAGAFNIFSEFPIQALREYYGEEVAFYFAWMNFYLKSLLFPAVSGLLIFMIRIHRGESIDTDSLTPFHGLITFFWAIMFTQFWSREEARLAYQWGTYSAKTFKETFTVRHEFQGIERISEVTKMKEIYCPPSTRRFKYFVSALVTLILLAGAFFAMILSLNMQGYINHKHDKQGWYTPQTDDDDCHHPFHFKFFANLSEEGNIFDSKNTIRSTLAVILHVAMVLSMNMGYRKIAEKLTDWENHESQVTHNNSLIFKRFFFEAFDAYIVLMYLAFYEQDVTKVRSELINVFNVDTFRRLLLEGVIPFITTKMRLHRSRSNSYRNLQEKADMFSKYSIGEEADKEPYEEFDDYIEMIVQFGYICLFASAYPLAPFVAILANWVEMRLDAFKITHVHRRPWAVPTSNIGIWSFLIRCIVWLSAITNCMIFCFSSMQMVQYLPEYFTVDGEGDHDLKESSGWLVVFIVFGIERFLLVVGIILCYAIPEIPEDVRIKEQQKDYINFRMFYDNKSQNDSKKNN
jgi:anoctamin-10